MRPLPGWAGNRQGQGQALHALTSLCLRGSPLRLDGTSRMCDGLFWVLLALQLKSKALPAFSLLHSQRFG